MIGIHNPSKSFINDIKLFSITEAIAFAAESIACGECLLSEDYEYSFWLGLSSFESGFLRDEKKKKSLFIPQRGHFQSYRLSSSFFHPLFSTHCNRNVELLSSILLSDV